MSAGAVNVAPGTSRVSYWPLGSRRNPFTTPSGAVQRPTIFPRSFHSEGAGVRPVRNVERGERAAPRLVPPAERELLRARRRPRTRLTGVAGVSACPRRSTSCDGERRCHHHHRDARPFNRAAACSSSHVQPSSGGARAAPDDRATETALERTPGSRGFGLTPLGCNRRRGLTLTAQRACPSPGARASTSSRGSARWGERRRGPRSGPAGPLEDVERNKRDQAISKARRWPAGSPARRTRL
jgi:hypothetical protein